MISLIKNSELYGSVVPRGIRESGACSDSCASSLEERCRMANINIQIINGPGKWDLMLSLFEARPVKFRVNGSAGTNDLYVRIDMLEREDGSNESWNFQCCHPKLKGHYSTKTRTGLIKVE